MPLLTYLVVVKALSSLVANAAIHLVAKSSILVTAPSTAALSSGTNDTALVTSSAN